MRAKKQNKAKKQKKEKSSKQVFQETLDFILWLTPCEDLPTELLPDRRLIGKEAKKHFKQVMEVLKRETR